MSCSYWTWMKIHLVESSRAPSVVFIWRNQYKWQTDISASQSWDDQCWPITLSASHFNQIFCRTSQKSHFPLFAWNETKTFTNAQWIVLPSSVCCSVVSRQCTRRSCSKSWITCSRSLGISKADRASWLNLREKIKWALFENTRKGWT